MVEVPLTLLFIAWILAACSHTLRQAQYFQIEEYDSRRYLRWALGNLPRIAPKRALGIWLGGNAIALLLWRLMDSPAPHIVMIAAALLLCLPRNDSEAKKPFVPTGRAKRILAASFFCSALFMTGATTLAHLPAFNLNAASQLYIVNALGFSTMLLSPVWLCLGNLLMAPAEAVLRRRYLASAHATLQSLNPKVVGITGSYGKTTTKTFLRDILSLRYHTYATPKSYNTLMGVSLAINRDLADDYRAEYFISEMGAYAPGEIARICQLTPPHIAIVTEVGPQHLERFGSLENVQRAKYEIIENLPPDGVGIFNWDNAYIRDMIAKGYPNTRLSVSRELDFAEAQRQGVDWIATDIEQSLDGLRFRVTDVATGESEAFKTALYGAHNVTNLLLCVAVAVHEGIPLRDIARRAATLQPAESRLARQTTAAGITIINDAYSANPAGAASALKLLRLHDHGRRLLITPGMVELGDMQDDENRALGALAAECATDVILVGEKQTRAVFDGIASAGFDMARVLVVDELAESVKWYQRHLAAGDTALFLNDLPDTY